MKSSFLKALLVAMAASTIMLAAGCSNNEDTTTQETPSTTTYETYTMPPDDIRLRYLRHPLFTFEYPIIFKLIEMNEASSEFRGGLSMVHFIYRQHELPEPSIVIAVAQPFAYSIGYNHPDVFASNAVDVYNGLLLAAQEQGDITNTGETTVSGFNAYYFTSTGTVEEWALDETPIYPIHEKSIRSVTFDYDDLIWAIGLEWYYIDSEPPEVEEYWNHILETFTILE